ncbi:MAG TPA: hypothetical protein VF865_05835 [Acidobacteriaceae bacterium]
MMRRILLVAILLLCSAAVVHAQAFSIYATSSSGRFSNVQTGSVLTTSGFQNRYTDFWASGIGGGVTFNLIPVGPVRIGLDFRGSTRPGTTGADTAMAGVKVGFHPPVIPIKPYIQASGGYVATRTVNVSTGAPLNSTFNNQYAAWEILGGVDFPLAPFLDLRVIELGGGAGTSAFGSSNSPNISLFTVNSGLVLHF